MQKIKIRTVEIPETYVKLEVDFGEFGKIVKSLGVETVYVTEDKVFFLTDQAMIFWAKKQ